MGSKGATLVASNLVTRLTLRSRILEQIIGVILPAFILIDVFLACYMRGCNLGSQ